jgi:3-oxoacyl-[acyl-carrier protein] reductase
VLFAYRSRHNEAGRVVARHAASGVRVEACACDLSTAEGHDTLAQAARAFGSPVYAYVANSGVWPSEPVPVTALSVDRWRTTMRTNLDALLFGVQSIVPLMVDGGRIVGVSSTAGQRGEAGHADYAASKGAMIAFVKSLAVELAPRDITVNAVAPGWVDTDAVAVPFAGTGRARIESAIPLQRVASAADIAGPILFLISDLARHVTGEILNVNGGSVLCG